MAQKIIATLRGTPEEEQSLNELRWRLRMSKNRTVAYAIHVLQTLAEGEEKPKEFIDNLLDSFDDDDTISTPEQSN